MNLWGLREVSGPPLDVGMDNVLAWKLSDAFKVARDASVGDPIDRGLALLRGLNELGFDVIVADENLSNLFPGRQTENAG